MAGAKHVRDVRDNVGFLQSVLTRWLPSHLTGFTRPRPKPAHVLFCMVDHYEPGTGQVDLDAEKERMAKLLAKYPTLADAHADASGQRPRRTWFFPPHYHRHGNLRELVSLCQRGYGEIELHLHHGKTVPDTPENLRHTLRLCLRDYSAIRDIRNQGRAAAIRVHPRGLCLEQLVAGRKILRRGQ